MWLSEAQERDVPMVGCGPKLGPDAFPGESGRGHLLQARGKIQPGQTA